MVVERRELLKAFFSVAAAGAVPSLALAKSAGLLDQDVTVDDLKGLEKVAGLTFTDAQRKEALEVVQGYKKGYDVIRSSVLDQSQEPPMIFQPVGGGTIRGSKVSAKARASKSLTMFTDEDLAFASVAELGELIRARRVTAVQLTKLYLKRLERHGDQLLCVITLCKDQALKQAVLLDKELAKGHYRGPLHGIPYGIKDLFDTKGIPTTFGAEPFINRIPEHDATVVVKLREAGAILLAKLSMGALAMDDHWFKGKTKNPWNLEEGSSGSSAGSASATAAGLVAFAVGTETQGSIVSPSHRCRISGLRPTYGRISRHGAMELTYSMDKVGLLCRRIEDCALVFAAICGHDPLDASSVDRPFSYPHMVTWSKLRVGYLKRTGIENQLDSLKAKGAKLVQIKVTPLTDASEVVLMAEAASAFDALTRSGHIDEVKESFWPMYFRATRYIPAVEYIQAQRMRRIAMNRLATEMAGVDIIVLPDIGGELLSLTNQCGNPQVIIPMGTKTRGTTTVTKSLSIVGHPYQEDLLITVAGALQNLEKSHFQRPKLS